MDADSRRRTAASYDRVAAAYDAVLPDTSHEAPADLAILDRFAALLPADALLLDAGCGTGRMLAHLRARHARMSLLGVDVSAAMLARAASACPEAGLVLAELARLPFADASVDGVLAWYSIIHTRPADLTDVLAEAQRVLRPDGFILLGFQAGEGHRRIERAYGESVGLDAHLHGAAAVATTLSSVGFDVLEVVERGARPAETHRQGFVLAQARRT